MCGNTKNHINSIVCISRRVLENDAEYAAFAVSIWGGSGSSNLSHFKRMFIEYCTYVPEIMALAEGKY